jgi:YD repeat-containing protein
MTRAEYYEAGALEPYQVNEYRYDAVGNLIWMSNDNVRLAYVYDDLDQRTQIDMWTPTWGATRTLQLDRDPLSGDLTHLDGPGAYMVDYEYDPLNRLATVIGPEGEEVAYEYDLGGRKIETRYPDGTLAGFEYDLTNNLTGLTYLLFSGETISYTYTYDERGNVLDEMDEGEVVEYDYDEVGRVVSTTNELQGQTTYSYDPVGNRLSAQNAVSNTGFVYDDHGRLLQAGDDTYTVNEMGARTQAQLSGLQESAATSLNRAAWGAAPPDLRGPMGPDAVTLNYQYDNDMRLLRVEPGITFLYDPLGNVIGTLDDEGNYRYFLRDGEDIYLELDHNGDVLAQYVIGADGVVSMWQDGGRYFFLYDGRGRVRRVLDLFSGQVVVRYGTDLNDMGSGPYYLYNPIRIHGAWWFPYVGLALFGDGVFWDYRSGVFLVKAWPWLYWPFGPFHPWRPIFRFWPWPWPWARPWGWPWPRPWPWLWPWPGAWVRPWVIWPFWPWGLRPWWPWWYWRAWWGWHWWGHWWCWHPWWWWTKWWWWPWWHPWWWWGYWWFPWWWWSPCWWWPGYWWWWNWWWWPWWWGGWYWWCWWWWWPWWWPGWFWWWPWRWPPVYAHGPPEVGDAPDPLYPSYRLNWGAVHGNWWYEWLGTWRDGEWDSEQVDADAYDDGVTVDLGNGTLTFEPTVAYPWSARYGPWGPLNVHGWADWNSDGDWDDAGEFITNWSGYPGDGVWPAGQSSLNVVWPFSVPASAFGADDVAELWLRFRLDYAHNLESPRGYTRFGEVEDHLLTVVRPHAPDWDGQIVGHLDASLVITYTRVVSDVQVSFAPVLALTPTWSVVGSGSQLSLDHAPFAPGQHYTVSLSSGVTYTGTGLVMPDDFGFDVSAVAPDDVIISGPTVGGTGQGYRFDADVSPLTTTLPVTYTWQATGQSDVVASQVGVLSHAVTYTWSTTGTQTITLMVENAIDTVSATHQIYISTTVPPGEVTISGPSTGEPGQSYTFVAEVGPDTTTPPIAYTWQASGQTDVLTSTDALSHSVSYVWPTTGVQTITVTAANVMGAVSSTHYITISLPPPVPPDDVTISGSDTGYTDQSYTFVAGVSPLTTTLPLTYTWQASGQTDVVTSASALSHSVSYVWSTGGVQTITVTAQNAAGAVSDTHQINISAVPPVPPEDVTIVGPVTGEMNATCYFTATATSPTGTVSLPLTFYWQATGQAPVMHANDVSVSDVVTFAWSTTGSKTITVTVTGIGGQASNTHSIDIVAFNVYLPLLLRR